MALESGFGNDSDRMGSMDFDEVLSDALPTVRGACFTIIAELLANPPRARDDVLAAARRKQGWVHYMQGVYSVMGWPIDELLLCLEESNAYVTTNERETTPAFNCLEKVLEELWEGNYSGDEFDVYSNNRVVVDDNEMKITTNMILEKIRRKAGDLRLHPAAVGSLPETGRGLADFFRYGEKWLEEAGLTVEKTLIGKHRLAGWKFTKIERREGV